MAAFLLSAVLPALFHPQELWNIVFAPLYFIAIPTNHLLTVVRSLCTFHLANRPRLPDGEDVDDDPGGREDDHLVRQIDQWERMAKEMHADPTKQFQEKVRYQKWVFEIDVTD